MDCPFCQSKRTEVFNSRKTRSHTKVWRRRRCNNCFEAFTTYEYVDMGFIRVIGSNGTTPYSRARLYSSIYLAFIGTRLELPTDIDNLTETIEHRLLKAKKLTMHRDEIINLVSKTLKPISITAAMRYLADHPPTDTIDLLKRL